MELLWETQGNPVQQNKPLSLRNRYLESKLQSAQRAMEQQMFKISLRDKIIRSIIRKQTGVTDITVRIKAVKRRCAGHKAGRNGNEWKKILTEWQPTFGKRGGRQERRWRDNIIAFIATTRAKQAEKKSVFGKNVRRAMHSILDEHSLDR